MEKIIKDILNDKLAIDVCKVRDILSFNIYSDDLCSFKNFIFF
jgi:hypothetical protein